MNYKLHEKEYENIIKLKPEQRFDYFLNKIADWEELYTIGSKDGFVLLGDDTNDETLPLFPHPGFAESFLKGEWQDCEAQPIDVYEFLEHWIPGLTKDKKLLSVFPVSDASGGISGIIIEPDKLQLAIEQKMEQYD